MSVVIAFAVPEEQRATALDALHDVLVTEPDLSPRSRRSLTRSYERGDVCFALAGGTVVGWVLCLSRGADAQELAGAYVVPDRRGSDVVRMALPVVLRRRRYTICLTSNARLATYLRRFWGFRRCGPWTLLRLAGASLIRDRLSPARLRYGRAYVRAAMMRALVFEAPRHG
jgi:hypothetical protein